MYYRKIGVGKPIVFLHGWGCDGSIFLSVAANLVNFKSYLPDFNGFGKSPMPPQSGWNVENYAESVRLFFKQHNLRNVCVVSHSFGCRVAMVLAAKYPDSVQKMLLVAPAGLRSFSLKRKVKVLKYKFCKHFNPNKSGCGSTDYNACDQRLKNTFVKVVNQDMRGFAKRIKCPVLIVNGKSDSETPLKHARRLNKIIPNCTLAEIDGGHFAFFRNPAAFAQTVTYFVGENL